MLLSYIPLKEENKQNFILKATKVAAHVELCHFLIFAAYRDIGLRCILFLCYLLAAWQINCSA